MHHYCTYFDRNYLIRGIALLQSLLRHEEENFLIFVICMDEISRLILGKINFPKVVLIGLHQVEKYDPEFLKTRQDRSIVEYYWTSTPVICNYLFEKFNKIEILIYLDADILFFSSPDPVFEEFKDSSILIHEHRFSPQLSHLEVNGKYNVGLVGFKNDHSGREAVTWWRDRCIEWCYYRIEDGKLGDQLYLNDWPTRFHKVRVLDHPGAALAPWNHDQYRYTHQNEQLQVEGKPVIFYHFQSFQFLCPEVLVPAAHAIYPLTVELLKLFCVPYQQALVNALDKIKAILPEFDFGLRDTSSTFEQQILIGEASIAQKLLPKRVWYELTDKILYSPSSQLKEGINEQILLGNKE